MGRLRSEESFWGRAFVSYLNFFFSGVSKVEERQKKTNEREKRMGDATRLDLLPP